MTKVNSREKLEKWLNGQEPEVCVAMAARVSLRVLPFLSSVVKDQAPKNAITMVLSVFRALSITWFAGAWRKQGGEIKAAASAANASAYASASDFAVPVSASASASAFASASAVASVASSAAASAATAASAFDVAPVFYIWDFINTDISLFEETQSVEEVMERPLWLHPMPNDAREHWQDMKAALLDLDEDWQVWTNWYEDRLVGGPKPNGRLVIQSLEKERVLIPDEDWEKGAAHVNRLIAEMEVRYQVPQKAKQKPAIIELEVGEDDKIHQRAPHPPTPEDEAQKERWKSAWAALRETVDDFVEVVPELNDRFVNKSIKRYDDALGRNFEEMDVIKAGVHARRLANQFNRLKDELMDDVVEELAALLSSHHEFIRQMPEWLAYLKDNDIEIAREDVRFAIEVVRQLPDHPELTDEQVRDAFERYADEIEDDVLGEDGDIVTDPLKIDFVRSVGNLLAVTASTVANHLRKGALSGFEKLSESFIVTLGTSGVTKIIETMTSSPSEYAWLLPLVVLLTGKKKDKD